mgnify:CR=1 FL=1
MKLLKTPIFLYELIKIILNRYFTSFHIVCEKPHDIGKGNPPRNGGTVGRKVTRRVSVGRSAPIGREPDPDPKKPTKESGSDCTMPKDPKKSERGQPS